MVKKEEPKVLQLSALHANFQSMLFKAYEASILAGSILGANIWMNKSAKI